MAGTLDDLLSYLGLGSQDPANPVPAPQAVNSVALPPLDQQQPAAPQQGMLAQAAQNPYQLQSLGQQTPAPQQSTGLLSGILGRLNDPVARFGINLAAAGSHNRSFGASLAEGLQSSDEQQQQDLKNQYTKALTSASTQKGGLTYERALEAYKADVQKYESQVKSAGNRVNGPGGYSGAGLPSAPNLADYISGKAFQAPTQPDPVNPAATPLINLGKSGEGASAAPSTPFNQVVAYIESNGKADAKNPNSSAKGLYQFTNATAKQYGIDPTDPAQAEKGMNALTHDNAVALSNGLGQVPTDPQLYVAHQQGAGGALALYKNPDKPAIAVLTSVLGNSKLATDAIKNNGGNINMSAGDFAKSIESKYNAKASSIQPTQYAAADTGSQSDASAINQGVQAQANKPTPERFKMVTVGADETPYTKGAGSGKQWYYDTQNGNKLVARSSETANNLVNEDNAGLTGKDFLKTLSPEDANTVQQIAEGKLPVSGRSLDKIKQYAAAAQAYDPTFDATNYNARSALKKDATSGKLATSTNALSTALGHAGELLDKIDALHNTSGFIGATTVNAIKNYGKDSAGDTRVTDFNQVRDALSDEIVKAYRGSGGAEADIIAQKKNLDSANSPEQLRSTLHEVAKLLNSKIEANQQQYINGMGGGLGELPKPLAMTTDAAKVMDRLENGAKPASKAPASDYQSTPGGVKYRVVQ